MLDDTPKNDNELHQVICNNFKIDYFQDMDVIIKLRNRLECKINNTLLALLPNKLNIMRQGLATSGENVRNKRAISALAIMLCYADNSINFKCFVNINCKSISIS